MRIRIKALDTLFFRDGKPFERGDESWADGIFPPPPSVFYGALRSLYFSLNLNDFHLANKENDPTKKLVITNIDITRQSESYFPCPADFVQDKAKDRDEDDAFFLLNLNNLKTISSNKFENYSLSVPKEDIEVESLQGSSFLSNINFNKFINGNQPKKAININDFIFNEPKVGIGRNNLTFSVEESMLYRVGMMRLSSEENEKLCFEIEFNMQNFELPIGYTGTLKLGGEGKIAEFEIIKGKEENKLPQLSDKIFKIYIKTPSIFINKNLEKDVVHGWLPSFLDKNLEGKWNGVNVKLIACSIGKSKQFGGFNMVERRPKPMYKAIPEGSVYFFEILDEKVSFQNENQAFCFSDERKEEGFGISYLTNVNTQLPKN